MQPLTARLVTYGIRDGQHNMAIDEHLLLRHGHAGEPVLRLYGWSPPSITLGRYQKIECLDRDACRSEGVSVVRRITGGGAIFHDDELTYSVVWPAGDRENPDSAAGSFKKLNAFIMETYRSLGMKPVYSRDAGRESSTGRVNFCFSGNEEYDILVGGKKIGGNAQRRVRGALLQHGSMPFSVDYARAQRYFRDPIEHGNFSALREACGREIGIEELARAVTDAFRTVMGVDCTVRDLDDSEEENVRSIALSRYSSEQWTVTGTDDEV